MSFSQTVLPNHVAHLFYLVRLGFAAIPLQIYLLFHPGHPEHMVAPADTHVKTHSLQQTNKVCKPDIRVGFAAQDLKQQFLVFAHGLILSPEIDPRNVPHGLPKSINIKTRHLYDCNPLQQ